MGYAYLLTPSGITEKAGLTRRFLKRKMEEYDAIKAEIVTSGRFTIPDFGAFAVRETPKRTGLNPKTGEKVQIKAGATVRFKASPALKAAALSGVKKGKRKAKA